MTKRFLVGLLLVIAGVGVVFLRGGLGGEHRDLSVSKDQGNQSSRKFASISKSVESNASQVPRDNVEPSRPIKSTASGVAHRAEFERYAELKKKVLLSDKEKSEKQAFVMSLPLLKEVASRLVSLPLPSKAEQASGIDLIVEALTHGNQEAAEQSMTLIVGDNQIERSELAKDQRQALAGIKAEVLYQWAAIMPNRGGEISGLMPGPVSRKIWDNVKSEHARNQAESASFEASR